MRILFMGTPEISAVCLKKMIDKGLSVKAVVSGEDKPRGRGKVMTPTPTKALAVESGIAVYTPKTLRDAEFIRVLSEINPELIVVVAYGKILPKEVIDYPKHGCINVHVSLLPRYRGAAPMQRAIMNGDKTTGVTIMYMDEGLDTGDIIEQAEFPISESDDFEAIHDRSAEVGGELLLSVIEKIENGCINPIPQDSSLATYARKIEKEDAKIDLTQPAQILDPIIRGLTPIPGAYVLHNGKMLKISRAVKCEGIGAVGEVIELDGVGEGGITVACGKDALRITKVIPEGKGKMSAGDYIRGRKIQKGDILL